MNARDKVAIVTGGAGGIGLATAVRLGEAGARVAIADVVDEAAGGRAADAVRARGAEAIFIRTDVTSLESVDALFKQAAARFEGVDVLFNNAGVLGGPRFPEAGPKSWLKAINVNLVGVMNCIHVGVPYLKARGGGVIVNTASTAGLKSSYLDPAYAMTKAGVVSLTRSLTFLQQEAGIRINSVCPALVKTALADNTGADYDAADLAAFHKGRAGRSDQPGLTPQQVADAVMRLIEQDDLNGYAYAVAHDAPPQLIAPVAPQKV